MGLPDPPKIDYLQLVTLGAKKAVNFALNCCKTESTVLLRVHHPIL